MKAKTIKKAKTKWYVQRERHKRRFPLPQIEDTQLLFSGVAIPLRGRQRDIFLMLGEGMSETDSGWEATPKPLVYLKELGEYKTLASTRSAIEKLKKKLKVFEKEGLRISIIGNYRKAFGIKFRYSK